MQATIPATSEVPENKVRLTYLVSHPIQYQAPLLRRIAQEPDIDLTVLFASDFSVRGYKDEGFGVGVTWDVPLLDGYRHVFLPRVRDTTSPSATRPLNYGIFRHLRGAGGVPAADVLWVHGYSTVNSLHGMLAAKSLGIPVLLRAESWLKDRHRTGPRLAAKAAFFKLLKSLVDAVLPIGTLNAAYWHYYFGHDIPQFLMPYAVDNQYFQARSAAAAKNRSALQAQLGLDPSRPVILFASKLQSRKHCDHLLEAFLTLRHESALTPPPYLLIVGDGEERKALEARAAASGVEGIHFCGFRNQSELPGFFDLASVFVLPSRHEPWGLIVNEVMNASRAVIISTDVGCQPDLITDGVEGCLFPPGDVPALTAALRRVLATPGTAARMGASGLQTIQQWSFEQDIHGLRQALAHVTKKIQP